MEKQNRLILTHLQTGATITALEALKLFGCLRLSARIWDLKKNYYIRSTMVRDMKSGKRFKKYWLAT
jgi:hypothetical protein